MATTYTMKQHDTRPILELHLTEGDPPTAMNLTGALSAKLIMKSGITTVTRTAVISDALNGILQVTFQSPDTDFPGNYDAEVEITWSAGAVETVPNDSYLQIVIKADLG